MNMKGRIIYSKAGLEVVTQPFLVGNDLREKALTASTDFVKILQPYLSSKDICTLDILMGGRFYQMQRAFENVGLEVNLSEVRAKRCCKNNEWFVNVWFDDENSSISSKKSQSNLLNCSTLVIGDTVATGTTLHGVLHWLTKFRKNCEDLDVYIFAIAGTSYCERKLNELEKLFKSIKYFYCNASFNLLENGTDLSFVGAQYHPQAKKYVDHLLGDYKIHMKCACWDWGDRFTNIIPHLEEISDHFDKIQNTPSFIIQGINNSKAKHFIEEKKEEEKLIHNC